MDHNHNHGHWFVFGALFSIVTFGAISMMEMSAKRSSGAQYSEAPPFEPLLIVIPAVMLLVVALAIYKWWHERA